MNVSEILTHFPDARKSGNSWICKCPAHADRNPSLSISEGDKGIVLHCHAGCQPAAVCGAVGLKLQDLFTKNGHEHANGALPKILETYRYVDAAANLLFEVVRFFPKTFRQRRPDSARPGEWVWNMDGVARCLYRLPEILRAKANRKPVCIVEGEKDADTLAGHGMTATTNSGGAGKWKSEYTETLAGCDCYVIADKDEAGRAHGQQVAASLYGKAKSVRVLELPDVNGKHVKDTSDFFNAGATAADFIAQVDAAPEWTPADAEWDEPKPAGLPEIDNAATLCADENLILPEQIIEGVLHRGLKAVLGSNSKARKTWILLDAAISVATGTPFWKWNTTKGRVLYINFEIPRAFIRSRIKTLCRAKNVSDVSGLDVWTLRGHAAPLYRLLPELIARIKTGAYSLIVVDPIYKGLGGRDENSAGDISELCNELERLAVATGAAILFAAHFSKGNQANKEAIDRIGGSGVWGRDADSIITLTKHDTEGAYTVDLILRNLPEQPPFVVEWDFPLMHEAVELDPANLKQIAGRKPENSPDDLLKLLPEDGLPNADWLAKADDEGIAKRTYYRLRKTLEREEKIMLSKVNGKWKPILTKPDA